MEREREIEREGEGERRGRRGSGYLTSIVRIGTAPYPVPL